MKYGVSGKVALVTGGAQGIGLEVSRLLVERGCSVVLTDVQDEALDAAVARLGAEHALGIVADVCDREAMVVAVQQAVARFGRLDLVVANAGVTPPPATIRSVDRDAFDRVIAVNQEGVVNTVRAAIEEIIINQGHVVVVSSVAAFAPGLGGAAYMMSKAAIEQFGRALRLELSLHGATAGVAYFGVIDTPMTKAMFDEHPLGDRIAGMLPWPFNRRVRTEAAARVLVGGIERRAARTMAPAVWTPYSLFRGALNVVMDEKLLRDSKVRALLRDIDTPEHVPPRVVPLVAASRGRRR